MGFNLSILSMFGLVALTGVVVNDSLLLVNFANEKRRAGVKLHQAVMEAAQRRFRPIILTSLTTSLGLTPIIFEKSMQAQFLIPMAVSLGFGILFATFITLLLIPSIYLILEDVLSLFKKEKAI
jgi:multidrug efflux pump subunit AcrB